MGNSASACVARLKLASTGLLEAWQRFFREQASDLIMTNGDKWWFKRYEWEYQQVGCVWKWGYWENHKMIALIGGKRWFTIKCWALSQNCQTDPHHEDAKFEQKILIPLMGETHQGFWLWVLQTATYLPKQCPVFTQGLPVRPFQSQVSPK